MSFSDDFFGIYESLNRLCANYVPSEGTVSVNSRNNGYATVKTTCDAGATIHALASALSGFLATQSLTERDTKMQSISSGKSAGTLGQPPAAHGASVASGRAAWTPKR